MGFRWLVTMVHQFSLHQNNLHGCHILQCTKFHDSTLNTANIVPTTQVTMSIMELININTGRLPVVQYTYKFHKNGDQARGSLVIGF
jgi:hypothetical protein